ncbi:MAG TPA: TlpA disulfide reductase family protein [Pyrinomonadaceae bacterium]|nr:TlpA disulfide reductase family protein [Pyrinomonadaceae bacterium]
MKRIPTGELLGMKVSRAAFVVLIAMAALFLAPAALRAQEAVKLEGQVVCCAECWAEADRTKVEFGTTEDLLKAKSCVEGGDPTLLAVREGDKFTLHQLEQGKFRLPGKNWLEFVGKRVKVTGTMRKKKDVSIIRVDTLDVQSASLAEREAAKVLGQEVELKLSDLTGAEQKLSSLNGRVVVLNFWATYCIPCRKEMSDLAALQSQNAALGVQVIGASTDEIRDRSKVLQFVRETKVNFPIWLGATTADMMRFGLGSALPGTVVIGKDGKIAKVIFGVIDPKELQRLLDHMLSVDVADEAPSGTSEKIATATDHSDSHDASLVPS